MNTFLANSSSQTFPNKMPPKEPTTLADAFSQFWTRKVIAGQEANLEDMTTAKKSIHAFANHCKARIAEAEGFVLANDDTGITTPKIKRQATKIVGNLRNQFDRMEVGWNGISKAFSETVEEPIQTALEELQIAFGDIQWSVEDAEEKIMSMLDKATAPTSDQANSGGTVTFNPSQPPPVQIQQQKPPPKLDTSWRPEILSSEATLTELNSWSSVFESHVDANKEYLNKATNNMKRTFVTSLWDAKLKAALEANPAMKNVCNIKGADETPSLTKWLKNYV